MYTDAVASNWSPQEVDFKTDIVDLRQKLTPAEQHMIKRLVAFFATGDTIVANNLALNLYRHINAPEARMYLGRQLFEENNHVDFYLRLLDTYVPNHEERNEMFKAVDNIPSIAKKARFCAKWVDPIMSITQLETDAQIKKFMINLAAFALGVEGLFFMSAFAYIYALRSRGLLPGLSTGTEWTMRDESNHLNFAVEIINIVRRERPDLFPTSFNWSVGLMLQEAVECEMAFADDTLEYGVVGLTKSSMHQFIKYTADLRMKDFGLKPMYDVDNPYDFMVLNDTQVHTNFFENRVTQYTASVDGDVSFDEKF